MSNAMDLLNAVVSGDATGAAGDTSQVDVETPDTDVEDTVDHSSETDMDDWSASEADTETDEPVTDDSGINDTPDETEGDEVATAPKTDVEVVEIGDKKYKVDFANKDQVKAYLKKMTDYQSGMRKFQRERDDSRSSHKETSSELDGYKDLMKNLEKHQDDPNALLKIFSNGKMSLDQIVQAEVAKVRLREEATPEELAAMNTEDQLRTERKDRVRMEDELKVELAAAKEARSQAATMEMSSKLNPVFDKVRFAGKLGDPKLEHTIDTMLWQGAIDRLGKYDEGSISPQIVKREFAAVRKSLNRVANIKADAKIKKTSETKKLNAQEAAQVSAVRGSKNSGLKKEFAEKVRNRDYTSILSNPAKFFEVFNK